MRLSMPATTMGLCLMPLGWGVAMSVGTPIPAPTPTTTAPDTESDAAARHAKRTACLKEAKTRKLVGALRTAFIKECMSAH